MYNIGAYVSYKAEGVCVIVDIENRRFGMLNEHKKFYVLSPINDLNSKLFVPVDNVELVSKMQELCTSEELNSLAEELKNERIEWIDSSRQRSNVFRDILSEGKREMLIRLIHTIRFQAEIGKRVTQGDENALRKAMKMLVDEFSFTTDVTNEQKLIDVLCCNVKCESK